MSNEPTSNPAPDSDREETPERQPLVDVMDLVYTSSYSEEGAASPTIHGKLSTIRLSHQKRWTQPLRT